MPMPKSLLKLPTCALAVLLLACALLAGTARAATTTTPTRPTFQNVTVTKDASLIFGVSNADSTFNDLESSNASRNKTWTARAKKIGTQMVRIGVTWAAVAPATLPAGFKATNPASPGYNWTALDQQVRDLSAEGFKILLTVTGAPAWAEGPKMPKWAAPGSWKPNATDFKQFATAVATRYDGSYSDPLHRNKRLPRIIYFQAWNEPNLSRNITPQYTDEGPGASSHGRACPTTDTSALQSPSIYRSLLNSFYAGIKGVKSSDIVVSASLDPFSHPNCVPNAGSDAYRSAPLTFDEALFCVTAKDKPLSRCANPVHFDAFGTNPYDPFGMPSPCGKKTLCGPTWSAPGGDMSIADVSKLTAALNAAVKAHKVLPASKKWGFATEVAWDQQPLDRQGIPQATAALWQEQAYYILSRAGVTNILWWQLADRSPFDGWPDDSGEYLASGKAKPSATAFHFPFVTNRLTSSKVQIWGRAPQAGEMLIEQRYDGTWVTVAKFRVAALEVFQANLALKGAGSFRARLGSNTSLTWNQIA